jgi:RNA polymerase sigma-70 factor (ECF subfamily)
VWALPPRDEVIAGRPIGEKRNVPPLSDADLVAQARGGSEDACRTLVDRYQHSVYNLINRMVRDPGVAEELAQDTFVKVLGALHSFDPAYRFVTWVLRIAHNTAIDHLRRRRVETVPIDGPDDQPPSEAILVDRSQRTPLELAEQADVRRTLDWALAQLRPEYRRLIVLRYLEDLSYEEIVDVVGLPLGTVKSHLHRARAEMARLLTPALQRE